MRRASTERWIGFVGAVALGASLAGGVAVGPLATAAAADSATVPTGKATATALFATYSDRDTFTQGSTTVPPSTYVAYATGGFDNSGEGTAEAALAFNPYQDIVSASNGLCQEVKSCKESPVSPQAGADEFRTRNRARVRGQAPQSHDASVTPASPQLAAGTMRAALEEEGPAAVADALTAAGQLAPGVTVSSATSRIRVALTGGRAASVATSVLKGVSLGDALSFESVVVEATSTADGGPGQTVATVRVLGAAVNGTPVRLTDSGVVVADQDAPMDSRQVSDALKAAGIEFVAPGGRVTKPGADRAVAEARGPSFRLTGSEGQRLQFTLGMATVASGRFDFSGGSSGEPDAEDVPGATAQHVRPPASATEASRSTERAR